MKTLLDERYAPITSKMGFVEAQPERVAAALVGWRRQLGRHVEAEEFRDAFPEVLRRLEPLTVGSYPRELLLATKSQWTVYISNSLDGTDIFAPVSYLAKLLSCRSLGVASVPHTRVSGVRGGRYGALQFFIYGPRPNPILNYVRTVSVAHDGERWIFRASGEVQPFELADQYRARRVADRFTSETLERYCRALDIELFNPDFYGPSSILVRTDKPVPDESPSLTLEQAQDRLQIRPGQAATVSMPH